MIMTGTIVKLTTGETAKLMDGWAVFTREDVPFLLPDGNIIWRPLETIVRNSDGFVEPVPLNDDVRRLQLIWDIIDMWIDRERVGRMYRDPETRDAVKFVPFKGVIQEYAPFYGLSTDTAT